MIVYTPVDMNGDICRGMYTNIHMDTNTYEVMNVFPCMDMTWKFQVRMHLLPQGT